MHKGGLGGVTAHGVRNLQHQNLHNQALKMDRKINMFHNGCPHSRLCGHEYHDTTEIFTQAGHARTPPLSAQNTSGWSTTSGAENSFQAVLPTQLKSVSVNKANISYWEYNCWPTVSLCFILSCHTVYTLHGAYE